MRSEISVGRGVGSIVVVGVVLGLVYNGAGLASHPSRGIPWLAERQALVNLDSLTSGAGAGTLGAPGTPAAVAATTDTAGSGPIPASGGEADPGGLDRGSADAAGRAARPAPDAGGEPAAPSDSVPAAVRAAAPPASEPPPVVAVPFIPESDQPIQAKLATVKTLFDAGAALFLDARDPEEYDAGHIPGALRLTRQDALSEPDRMKTLPVRGRPIVAYCAGGVCEASRDLAEVLVEAGYRKVLVYAGGFPEWAAAGYPVERGSGGP